MPPAAPSSASAEGKQRTPRVTVQELTDSTIRFVLEGTDTSMANALRRVIIAEVPTIAIDLVEVIENSSCLCDEFLAHRLGLIPLLSEKASEMEFPYDYAGDDESKTDVSIDLRVKCVSDNTVDVTSDDLICNDDRVVPIDYDPSRSAARGGDPDAAMDANEDSSTAPDKKGILIVKLRKNQELNLRCVARKGIGRDHAKWQPVATAVYRFEPEITIDEDLMATLTEEEKREFAESSPAPIFRYNEQTRKVEIDAPETCTYDGECLKKAEELGKPGLVDIRAKQDVFLFTVESTGVLRPEEIVVHALNVLQRKLNVTKGELDILKKQEEERYGDRM